MQIAGQTQKNKKKQSRIFLQEQQHKWNKTKYIEEKPQMARTKKKKKGNTFLFLNMYNKKEENKFKLNENQLATKSAAPFFDDSL